MDSLGDIVAFKLHLDAATFWERINFVERLVMENYRETRKPLGKESATARAVAFLMRLKFEGPRGIMRTASDYFAVSRTELTEELTEGTDLLTSTAAVIYAAGR
jgi:hypothetical protein